MSTFKALRKAVIEKATEGELSHHLGYSKNGKSDSSNSRNGYGSKTVITDTGNIDISTPRDRDSSFEPQLIPKSQRRFKVLDVVR